MKVLILTPHLLSRSPRAAAFQWILAKTDMTKYSFRVEQVILTMRKAE